MRDSILKIQELQKWRVRSLAQRNRIDNGLRSVIAAALGYHAGLPEEERKKLTERAQKLIVAIYKEVDTAEDQSLVAQATPLILNSRSGRAGFQKYLKQLERDMVSLVETLPASVWVAGVHGFGQLNLAVIVGESGDLSNYPNPAKLWKRLGMAPINGHMPSTWRCGKVGKLTAEEWSEIGYNPRRRAAMAMLAMSLVNQNDGDLRDYYDAVKVSAAAKHPDWTKGHVDKHARLLLAKRAVLQLWCSWNGREIPRGDTQSLASAT